MTELICLGVVERDIVNRKKKSGGRVLFLREIDFRHEISLAECIETPDTQNSRGEVQNPKNLPTKSH